MSVTIGILSENTPDEHRVAATPDSVKRMVALGLSVHVQQGAGAASFYTDADYLAAGAHMTTDSEILRASNIILCVQAPAPDVIARIQPGTILAGHVTPYKRRDVLESCATHTITLMAIELVPRITRAQSMDALSSQSNLAGYRAVLEATHVYARALPMMMTAAGTIAAARVFVMGTGVAGLQAIATARRLGAIVSATDVRAAAREQVESLGATFVMVEDDETKNAETAGGYAREMSDAFKAKQAALIADTIKKQDIVITTALIPGRPAPRLVNADMIASMKPGSVIVDMAVENGGNVEGSVGGETIHKNGVTILGLANLAGRIPTDASALYARNLLSLVTLIYNKDTHTATLDFNDDIIKGMTLTHQGQIIHPQFGA